MPRKSRKNLEVVSKSIEENKKVYSVGIYTRLSKEDGGKKNLNTIENQMEMLIKYIEKYEDLQLKEVYIDNGFTGTNFERPDFNRLMNDLKEKKIDCVIVKDLSRFGRNYITVGEYLYKVFPSLDVRFISIGDNFDSQVNKGFDDIIISLKNLVNASYARDTSKKITTSLRNKQEKGKYIGSYVYGYKKLKEDKNKIIVDEKVSDIIVEIFTLRSKGISYNKIAEILNNKKILSPKKYLMEEGILRKEENYHSLKWSGSTICRLLKNQIYIGNIVQGKVKRSIFLGEEHVAKDNWINVKGTHEPIISMELWNKVNE